ncbi:hypothetical protein CGRA01v4_09274 [Colletotrichum graminicola]|nr:hypothetical protein CGRA01v4_09274 [Colletotrichum graminicola]
MGGQCLSSTVSSFPGEGNPSSPLPFLLLPLLAPLPLLCAPGAYQAQMGFSLSEMAHDCVGGSRRSLLAVTGSNSVSRGITMAAGGDEKTFSTGEIGPQTHETCHRLGGFAGNMAEGS